MTKTPHVAQRLLEMTLDELDSAREWMLLLGRKTAREKIASLLSIIGRRDASLSLKKASGRMVFDLPLTREEMAHADDMGDYYRIPADNRDLNYDLYFSEGKPGAAELIV